MIRQLELADFARLFWTSSYDFDDYTREYIAKTNFKYRTLDKRERDAVILDILKRIDSGNMEHAGEIRRKSWEKGWSENLERFINSGYDRAELVPKYVRPNQVLRLYRDYVMPCEANMEFNVFTVLRLWLFQKYLKNADAIYEFGCGTGYNLALMDDLFHGKKLYGMDWSESAMQILDLLRKMHGMEIQGSLFDMYHPDYDLKLDEKCAVITIGALEQIGSNHKAFIDFLINKNPAFCIHLEPIYEFYDENNLVDYLAARFHKMRNYLSDFLPALQALEQEDKIKIIETNRMYFGSMFHDGWSLTMWRPGGKS